MEKYSKRIRIFRNGDQYFTGKKILISPQYHRIYEQFLLECSQELSLRVKILYQLDGTRVRNLQDFVDGSCYICSNGEPFKNIKYNSSETGPGFNAYSKTNLHIPVVNDNPILERRHINASNGGLLGEALSATNSEESLFEATSKAFKIAVFENGEANQDGLRLILNHRNCKTFEQLMKYFSGLKIIRTGQIRKMYDVSNGKRIRHLHEIYNGMGLVLSAFDPFKKVAYKTFDLSSDTKVKRTPETPRIVKFYPNGDSYNSGITVTVTKRRHPTLLKLMDQLNMQIELVTGKIRKLYSMDGVLINSVEEIISGGSYILVANDEQVIKTSYNRLSLRRSNSLKKGLQGSTLHNEYIKNIRPVTYKQKKGDNDDLTPKSATNDKVENDTTTAPKEILNVESPKKSEKKQKQAEFEVATESTELEAAENPITQESGPQTEIEKPIQTKKKAKTPAQATLSEKSIGQQPIPTDGQANPAQEPTTDTTLKLKDSKPVLQSQASKPMLQSQASKPMLQSQDSKPMLQSQASKPVLQSQDSKPVLQSQASKPMLQSQDSKPMLQSQDSKPVLQSQASDPEIPVPVAAPLSHKVTRAKTPAKIEDQEIGEVIVAAAVLPANQEEKEEIQDETGDSSEVEDESGLIEKSSGDEELFTNEVEQTQSFSNTGPIKKEISKQIKSAKPDSRVNSPPAPAKPVSRVNSSPIQEKAISRVNSPPVQEKAIGRVNSPPAPAKPVSRVNSPPIQEKAISRVNSPPVQEKAIGRVNSPPAPAKPISRVNSPPVQEKAIGRVNSPPEPAKPISRVNSPPVQEKAISRVNSPPVQEKAISHVNSPPAQPPTTQLAKTLSSGSLIPSSRSSISRIPRLIGSKRSSQINMAVESQNLVKTASKVSLQG